MEGNSLSLEQTDLVINEGQTISGKSMREHLEAINHQEDCIYQK
jgi:Fic family protein